MQRGLCDRKPTGGWVVSSGCQKILHARYTIDTDRVRDQPVRSIEVKIE